MREEEKRFMMEKGTGIYVRGASIRNKEHKTDKGQDKSVRKKALVW